MILTERPGELTGEVEAAKKCQVAPEQRQDLLKAPGELCTIFQWLKLTENGIMDGKVTLDRAGRIVLPKGVRDELHLSPGDTLDFSIQGDEVRLRPRRNSSPLQKERGIWVLRTGEPLSARETDEVLRDIREQRVRKSLGERR